MESRLGIPTLDSMMRSFWAAAAYMALGLVSGLFYREYTKLNDVPGAAFSQLAVLHTHLLALGMTMFLVVLCLDALFRLSGRKSFEVFFWTYNVGLVVTVAMLTVRGVLTVGGRTEDDTSAAIPGIAGLGHMLLAAGLVALFVALGSALKEKKAAGELSPARAVSANA